MKLAYIAPLLTLIGTALVAGLIFTKDEKLRAGFKLAVKIVGALMGIMFLIMVIGFVSAFIRLNF